MRSVCRAADRKQKFALQKRYVKKHILSACISRLPECAARQRRTAAMLDEIKKLSAVGHVVKTEVRNYQGSPCVGEPWVRPRIGRAGQMGATTQDNSLRAMKARQTRKIEQLREVFLTNGRLRVREQAKLLGLCPSTAHAVLQRNYKNSGPPQRSSSGCWRAQTYPIVRGLSFSNTATKKLPVCTATLLPKDVDLWPRSQRNRTLIANTGTEASGLI